MCSELFSSLKSGQHVKHMSVAAIFYPLWILKCSITASSNMSHRESEGNPQIKRTLVSATMGSSNLSPDERPWLKSRLLCTVGSTHDDHVPNWLVIKFVYKDVQYIHTLTCSSVCLPLKRKDFQYWEQIVQKLKTIKLKATKLW